MALLKFEPPKELAPLRVKIARPVHERVERALVYVMDHDADFRAHEKGSATARAKGEPRPNASRGLPRR